MSRLVAVRQVGPVAAAATQQDSGLTRIAKYVPAEILAFFAMWTQAAALVGSELVRVYVEGAGALIGLVVTFIYFATFFPNDPPEARRVQRWISSGAFLVYAYNLSVPVLPSGWFNPAAALLATALITLISAVVVPKQS